MRLHNVHPGAAGMPLSICLAVLTTTRLRITLKSQHCAGAAMTGWQVAPIIIACGASVWMVFRFLSRRSTLSEEGIKAREKVTTRSRDCTPFRSTGNLASERGCGKMYSPHPHGCYYHLIAALSSSTPSPSSGPGRAKSWPVCDREHG